MNRPVQTNGPLGPQEAVVSAGDWLRGLDLNQRPLGYEGKSGYEPHRDEPIEINDDFDLREEPGGFVLVHLGRFAS